MSQHQSHKFKSLFIALTLLLIGFTAGALMFDDASLTAQQQTPQVVNDIELHLANLFDQISPSVVAITVTQELEGSEDSESPFDDPLRSSGSGFVIDLDGHIVTNFHVVETSEDIVVYFVDGTITRASVVGLDPDSDIAVIKVDLPPERLIPVPFGRTDEVFVGQSVVAIGSPFGNDWTLTSGIVSALDRDIPSLSQYRIGAAIQTDAAINPGNSGGPLLNLNGQVIGVNAQIASETRSNSGIGFAIPGDLVQRVAKELIDSGEVAYSVIGIRGGDLDIEVMEALDLADNQQGVLINEVIADSPADDAGLRNLQGSLAEGIVSADIITAINDEPIDGIGAILSYLARFTRPGDTIDVTVLRDGEVVILPLVLGRR